MKMRSWSISDLARYAGVARGSIGNILREERAPGSELCGALARALKIPPDVVYRHAGLLPPKPDMDEKSQEIIHLYQMMDEVNQNELLEYARLRLRIQEGNGKHKRPATRPASS